MSWGKVYKKNPNKQGFEEEPVDIGSSFDAFTLTNSTDSIQRP